MAWRALLGLVLLVGGCPDDESLPAASDATADAGPLDAGTPDPGVDASPRSTTGARFDLAGGFFAAPFPIDTRRRADGTIDVTDFPNPRANDLLAGYLETVGAGAHGFSLNGSVLVPFDGPLDPATLPGDLDASLADDATAFFVDVDPASPERGRRFPVQLGWSGDVDGLLRPANLLTMLPYPGLPQRAETLYAAVVTDGARGADGLPLAAPAELAALLAGDGEEALREPFAALVETLAESGLASSRVVAATVYRTGDPVTSTLRLLAHADTVADQGYTVVGVLRDTADYCTLEAATRLPIYQAGERVYTAIGSGEIPFDAAGDPSPQWWEDVRISITVPKGAAMPEAGFPLLFYSAGQGGKYTQVVDRGTFAEQAADPEGGRGPALYLAQIGVAALSIEAPLAGPRHPDGSYAGLDFPNFSNLGAFRDNMRQAAAEFVVLANLAKTMAVPVAEVCAGVDAPGGEVRFDSTRFALYGHSTGASIAELTLAYDRDFSAGMLSGAGGSWIYNLALKEQPTPLATLAELALELPVHEPVDVFHPVTLLFQLAAEPAEPMAFARRWAHPPPGHRATSVLFIEGVVDGYFLPRMANALIMAGRLDLAGEAADPDTPADLARVESAVVPLPAAPNRAGASAYAVQFAAEGFDGHYVPFELGAVKHTYKCWLDSWVRTGAPVVSAGDPDGEAACP